MNHSDAKRKPPARWRSARFPDAGTRWNTPMNRYIWNRDRGRDRELWRGGVHLATASSDGRWTVHIGRGVHGEANNQELAMIEAKKASMEIEEQDDRENDQ